ncbi:MAG: hypothetical protein OXP71_04930 [Candidatus Poribacteria bacterium]|nr:hypothetical protein [Candidatus Poribacteria bacterium]
MNRPKTRFAFKDLISRFQISAPHQSILKNLLIVTPVSLMSRGGTLLIYAVLANWFGVNPEMDFLYYYWGIAVFLVQILSSASAYSILIPLVAEERTKSQAHSNACLRAIFSVYLVGMPSICCVLFTICYIVSSLFLPRPDIPDIITIGIVCGFAVFTISASIRWLLKGVLDAYQRFSLPAIVQALAVPAVIGLTYALKPSIGLSSIVFALIISELLQTTTLFIVCRFSLKIKGLFSLVHAQRHWRAYSKTKRFVKQFFLMMGTAISAGANPVVDRGMSSSLSAGAVSKLDYSFRLCTIPETVAGVIMPVLLSHWSAISADANIQFLRQSVWKGVLVIVGVMGPIIYGFYFFRIAIVDLLYGHGAMSEPERFHVASLLGIYLIGTLPRLISRLLIRAHLSLQNVTFVFSATLLRTAFNPILNLIFMKRWGLEGIALSTTLLSFPSMVYIGIAFLIVSRRRMNSMKIDEG